MEISSEMHGEILALKIKESRLDAAAALSFKEKMRTATASHGGRVVIDMRRVDFLDSSGLGALVAGMKMLDGGRRLELARCGPIVEKVLRLTRMDSVFVLHRDLPWTTDGQDAA
ncbi:STAS domain-containing protein [Jannaschia seohaensis]|uniref:Anti-sigma B factor antagonist n=1 Tax=Jannaschia seohaensis TaxID=475081 RepID=A0A2Y9B426_9RHOB|nr:STAS domain-containing protein [Jannaschia seohaensis]PWJ14495.1 anti-sigma B factor antagonist [Jannaschia seohaensis]SSA50258.1 anti-sigma B factor antagonist [Jannaschia seohaensis]